MTNISLRSPSSQPEKLDTKATTITLSSAARHGRGIEYMPGYHHHPGKLITNVSEAQQLPEGAVKLTGNLVPPDQTYESSHTTYSRIPWMLGDRVCIRTVQSEGEKGTGKIARRTMQDNLNQCHRLFGNETSFAKPVDVYSHCRELSLFPPAYQEIEIDGKPGIIFTQNHMSGEPMLHYYCDGDWRVIQKLKKLYCESHGLEMTESPATPSVLGRVFERVREILGR